MAIALLTNDDGIMAPGINALYEELSKVATVYTVAPDRERSASGHSLTIHKPLKVTSHGQFRYSVNGTPTDCVAIAVEKILPRRADIIVSGINNGPNLGDDITYSGTVSAAMEGTILSIPSIALSLNVTRNETPLFETAAKIGAEMALKIIAQPLPYDTLLNINVPNLPPDRIAGTRLTRQGKRIYDGAINDARSPWGDAYYWIGGGTPYWEHAEDTDMCAIQAGFVSVTPLQLDLTNYWALDYLKKHWSL